MTTSVIDTLDTRYARQLSLPEVGRAGQELLAGKRVAVIGAGGLGSTLLPILVGAGVGHLILIDDDVVSVGNLPRQTLYTTEQVGESKACCALERLRKANPHCQLTAHQERLTAENVLELIGEVDLLIDATDNEATRRLLDRYALEKCIPWLYASLEGWCGQVALFLSDASTRYADLFPEAEELSSLPSPVEPFLVIASTPALIGSIAAAEALKYLLGLPSHLTDGLLLVDSLHMSFQLLRR
jgi:thiF protein